jgi:hypothetical protein
MTTILERKKVKLSLEDSLQTMRPGLQLSSSDEKPLASPTLPYLLIGIPSV